jgi:hypothetical protein
VRIPNCALSYLGFFKPYRHRSSGRNVAAMNASDPSTSPQNDDAARQEPNRSALDEVAHPFDQTNGIVEDVDRRHGETHHNDEQLDADPDVDPDLDSTPEDEEPGRESPDDRRPLVNTELIAEEVFGDDERRKPRFD